MAPQAAVSFSTANGGSNVVYMDETEVYQGIEGFGAATTDSAMYLLNEVAKPEQPAQFTAAMNNLFTRQGNGIGLSFLRNPMGASDLARSVYSFDDNNGQADPALANFSIGYYPAHPASPTAQPATRDHGQSLEPAGLDENFRFHDRRILASQHVRSLCRLFREIPRSLSAGRN
jgi:O-glycosyl hydrolase